MTLTRLFSASLLGLCLLGGCGGGTVNFTGNQRASAADGEAKWKAIDGGAILVEVSMRFLPPPTRVAEGTTTYLVWFTPHGRQPNLAGALEFNESNRTGRMAATNAGKRFEVMITAERSATVVNPSENVIARFQIDAR